MRFHREVIDRINYFEEILNKAIKGKKPITNFILAPELTKENTILIYAWILLSHFYLDYKSSQNYIDASADDSEEGNAFAQLETKKEKVKY